MTKINGTTDPKFSKLKEVFASCFDDHNEHGAGIAVTLQGKLVAELWAGHADKAKTRAWQRDTLVNVWSCTKGVVATAVAIAVSRGQLDYSTPISKIWPEFAVSDKHNITLDQVMSHQAGLNGFNHAVADDLILDWNDYTAELAAMSPNWTPGTTCAYHALTYGHLAAEPLRRATGKSIGQFITQEIAGPLGTEFYVGVPVSEDARAAEMVVGPKCNDWLDQVLGSKYPQSCKNPTPTATSPNRRAWRAAEIPGGNGHCTAAGLASIYGSIASNNSKLLSRRALAEASRIRFRGMDESFESPAVWGAGFRLEDPEAYGSKSSIRTVGHGGWGGAVGFGDPDAELGFAYVTNHMMGFNDGTDPRRKIIADCVYDALGS